LTVFSDQGLGVRNKIFADTDGLIIKALLFDCQRHFAVTSRTLDFVIYYKTSIAYWQIIGEMEAIATIVENIANDCPIIAVFPPDSRGVIITIDINMAPIGYLVIFLFCPYNTVV
jgi:hypothetical protein